MTYDYLLKEKSFEDTLKKDLNLRRVRTYIDMKVDKVLLTLQMKGYSHEIIFNLDRDNIDVSYKDIVKSIEKEINNTILINMETLSVL